MSAGLTPEMRPAWADVLGLYLVQLLRGLQPQALHLAVVHSKGQLFPLHPAHLLNVRQLALDVPLVFESDLHRLEHRGG